jgi:two-component system sensor histidine kinase HydH
MTPAQWVSLAAAIGQLMIALLALTLGRSSPLKVPLALLCLDVAAWTGASLMYESHPVPVAALWNIDHVLSPLTAPLALDFVLVFAGMRRASNRARLAAFVACLCVSISWLVSLLLPVEWNGFLQEAWGAGLLATSIPTMVFSLLVLVRHAVRSADKEERARTSLLLFVLCVGLLLGMTDAIPGFWVPRLANVGMLVCALGMALATIRFRLFDAGGARRTALPWWAAAVLFAGLCGIVTGLAGPRVVAVVVVSAAGAAGVVALFRERIVADMRRAQRTGELATLGRLSAQMDHDIRNPLAALKGAAQLLRRDLLRSKASINRLEFTNLMLAQIERMEVIFGCYRRMSRLELNPSEFELNEIVQAVLSRQAAAFPETVIVKHERTVESLPCTADADLLATILENLTRNAVEAMPDGGTLSVRTSAPPTTGGIELVVQDTGVGMDARTRERATDDFFTTKAAGTGLGLAFAKRVAEAHGGRLTIDSQVGQGTLVRLWVPSRPPLAASNDGGP